MNVGLRGLVRGIAVGDIDSVPPLWNIGRASSFSCLLCVGESSRQSRHCSSLRRIGALAAALAVKPVIRG
jgi:hypothetical protein